MPGHIVGPLTPEAIAKAYSDWLAAEGKVRSEAAGGIFAFECTNFGTNSFGGLSEAQICKLIGGAMFTKR